MHAELSGKGSALTAMGIGHGAAMGIGIRKRRRTCLAELAKAAWPAPGAALDLDFLNDRGYIFGRGIASALSLITFTRASTRTYFDSAGVLSTAAINTPAIDYDPVTLACRGLSIWEARTNLVIRSDDLTNAYWSNLINVSVTPGVADPDGGTTAVTLTATAASMVFGKAETATAGVIYTTSMWIRRRTGSGVISLYAGDNTPISITGSVTSTWQRLSVTGTATGSTTCRCYVALGTSGDAVDVCRMQLEAGSSASPYIPTTTAQVTRAADVAVISGANFTNFYNQAEGTFVVGFDTSNPAAAVAGVVSVNDNTSANQISIRVSSSTLLLFSNTGGATYAAINAGVVSVANTAYKSAGVYKLNDFADSLNGAAAVTDTAALVPTVTQMRIGMLDAGVFSLNGNIRSITYYPTRLTNAQLQTLST